ncbi:putative exported protein, partial [Plasmodium reichenowi]
KKWDIIQCKEDTKSHVKLIRILEENKLKNNRQCYPRSKYKDTHNKKKHEKEKIKEKEVKERETMLITDIYNNSYNYLNDSDDDFDNNCCSDRCCLSYIFC